MLRYSIRFLTLILVSVIASTSFGQTLSHFEIPSVNKGLVINEVYIGTTAAGFGQSSDQFVELYNPTSSTQYLDGKVIARFGTGGKLSGSALTSVAEAWKFPGRAGGNTIPVAPGRFVVIAATAKAYTGGLDLSAADWETYTGVALLDQDNLTVPNLTKIGANGLFVLDFALSTTQDAVVLTNGTDTVLTDGINISDVIDGVQYSTGAHGNLPAVIDGGTAGGSGLKLGVSLERATKGVSTNNSSADFVVAPPSPGAQHGLSGGGGTGGTGGYANKATDLFPAFLNEYVDYNQYPTDTNGIANTTSQTHASYTVKGHGITIAGTSTAILVRDTSSANGPVGGTPIDLHYDASAPLWDVKVLADSNYLNMLAPGSGSLLKAPNTFVDYIKLSAGLNHSYPITSITQNVTQGGVTATITATVTGSYKGIESVTVPRGTYDTAYHFANTVDIAVTAFGFPISDTKITQNLWLVKGIGIIKSNIPASKSTSFSSPGSERDMTSYGIRGLADVAEQTAAAPHVSFYPNPAHSRATLKLEKPAREIELFSESGETVSTIEAAGQSSIPVDLHSFSAGSYLARITYSDGSIAVVRLSVLPQ